MTAAYTMLLGIAAGAAAMACLDRFLLAQATWHWARARKMLTQAGDVYARAERLVLAVQPDLADPEPEWESTLVRIRYRVGLVWHEVCERVAHVVRRAPDPEWAAGELARLTAATDISVARARRLTGRSSWPNVSRRRVRRRALRPTPLVMARLPFDPTRQYRVKVVA